MVIWMKVTNDELELPIAVADNTKELAELCGTTPNAIWSSVSHAKVGEISKSPYRKVDVDMKKEQIESLWNDAEDPPLDDRYIILRFRNFSVPMIGRFDGNDYYIGDDDVPAIKQQMYVSYWTDIPEYDEGY